MISPRTMMLLRTLLLSSILWLSVMPVAEAARVANLYEAMVPVQGQGSKARTEALQQVLRKVITKVSGEPVLSAQQEALLDQAGQLVEQFGYRSQMQGERRQSMLWARLNADGVQRLLRQAGLPVLPEERPETLVWLAIEDEQGRQVIGADSLHPALKALADTALERGLPTVYPVMDLSEQSEIGFADVATLDPARLQMPSSRYGSQYLLIGHMHRLDTGHWQGRWRIVETGAPAAAIITTPVGSMADVIAAGVYPLASRMAQGFASLAYAGAPQYIDVQVQGLTGADDYASSLKYLQSLSLVSQVDVTGVEGNNVNFRLHTQADMAALLQVIELGRVLYARDSLDQLVFGLTP